MEETAGALVGINRVVMETGTGASEVVATWQPARGEWQVTVYLAEHADGLHRGGRRFTGWGLSIAAAMVHAWDGPLGVRRFTDPDGWAASRRTAGNPGPLAGQRMGRSDG